MSDTEPKKIWYVDIPDQYKLGDQAEWVNVGVFYSKEEAVQFIKDNIDSACTDGTIQLITPGTE